MGKDEGPDKTTITCHKATRERVAALLRDPRFASRFQLVPQTMDDVLNGLIDITEKQEAPTP